MNCPYCNKKISDDTKFCPHCGQTVSVSSSKSVENYWSTVNKEDKQRSAEYGAVIDEKARIANTRRTKAIVTAVIIIAVVAGVIFGFVNLQNSGEKTLSEVKAKLPGESFTYTSSQMESGFWIHYYYYRLDFKDDGQLDYYYLTTVGPKESDDSFELRGTYSYNISRSIFGKYSISFAGESFELKVSEDDNIPKSIKKDGD